MHQEIVQIWLKVMTEFLMVSLRYQELAVRKSEALVSKLLKYQLTKLYLLL